MVASVCAAEYWNSQPVRAGWELTGLALAPPVGAVVLVGRGEGARRGEGGELQPQIANIAAALTDRGRAGRTVVTTWSGSRSHYKNTTPHHTTLTGSSEVGVIDADGAATALGESAADPEATGTAAWGRSPQSRALWGGVAGPDSVGVGGAAGVGELDDVEHIEQLPRPQLVLGENTLSDFDYDNTEKCHPPSPPPPACAETEMQIRQQIKIRERSSITVTVRVYVWGQDSV